MKKPIYQLLPSVLILISLLSMHLPSFAQADEQRFKIELSINAGGKTAKTLLNSSSISFSRQDVYALADSSKSTVIDQTTNKAPQLPRDIYLSADANSISTDALEILAKHKGTLSGTIIVTDAYNQSQVKRIQFSNASLSGYSDQISAYGYNGKPGSVAFSFLCKDLTVDGISISP